MDDKLTVLITGTNKGIGCDLVRIFHKMNPNSVIIATSREEPKIAAKRWKQMGLNDRIICKQLDMKKYETILNCAIQLQKQGAKIDILINNAGVCRIDEIEKDLPSLQWVDECLRVNVLAQIQLTQQLLPLLSKDCKIVNVSSTTGGLKHQPVQTQIKFGDQSLQRQDVIKAVGQYVEEVTKKSLTTFSPNVYGTSKMLLGAWSRFVLKKQLNKGQISICATPGLCLTQMTQGLQQKIKMKAHTSQSGALKIYETILLPNLSSGIFYHRARQSNFFINGEGLPRE